MTRFTIRTVGNPSLYRSIQESLASETHHRTVTGALRRLEKIDRDSERWTKNVGQWGHVEIERDGEPLDNETLNYVIYSVALAAREDDLHARKTAEQLLSN